MKIKKLLQELQQYKNVKNVYVELGELESPDNDDIDYLINNATNKLAAGHIYDDDNDTRISYSEFKSLKDNNNTNKYTVGIKCQMKRTDRSIDVNSLINILNEVASISPNIDVNIAWQEGDNNGYNYDNYYEIQGIKLNSKKELVIYSLEGGW